MVKESGLDKNAQLNVVVIVGMMEFMMEQVIISRKVVNTYKEHDNDRGQFILKSLTSFQKKFIIAIRLLTLKIDKTLIISISV